MKKRAYYKIGAPQLGWFYIRDTKEESKKERAIMQRHGFTGVYIKKKSGKTALTDY